MKTRDLTEVERLNLSVCENTIVYVLSQWENSKYKQISIDKIVDIYYNNLTNKIMISFQYIWHDTEITDIGETVFLNEKDAELALEKEFNYE